MRRTLVVLGLLAMPLALHGHGGVGIPLLTAVGPGRGVILDAEATADIRWQDMDPDDNANLRLEFTPDLLDPGESREIVYLEGAEDCDATDAGSVFTGFADASVSVTQEQLNQDLCRATSGACRVEDDCWRWDTSAVARGNYFIQGILDDHWPDGGGGSLSFRSSRGIVRVSRSGQPVVPALLLTEPDGVGDQVDTCFRARWVDDDPDSNATIDLYVKPAFGPGDALLVARGIPEDDVADGYDINMAGAPELVDYQVIAVITDDSGFTWRTASPGYITRYVRLVNGQRVSMDGGCQGPPPAWPDGGGWPELDAGPGQPDAAPAPDAGMRRDGGRADAATPAGADASANARDASTPSPTPNNPLCRDAAAATPAGVPGLAVLALLLAARLRSRRS